MNKLRWIAGSAMVLAAASVSAASMGGFSPYRLSEIDKTISELGFLLGAPFKFKSPEGPAIAAKVKAKFEELDKKLSSQRFLVGNQLTEADVAFYPAIVRYSVVFIEQAHSMGIPAPATFHNLQRWLLELGAMDAFKVVDLGLIAQAARS